MFTGVAKLLIPADDLATSMPSFLSIEFIRFIGFCEVLGAIGLVVPWLTRIKSGLTPLAAAGLVTIMIGATFITAAGSVPQAIIPGVSGILAAFVAWGRRSGGQSN